MLQASERLGPRDATAGRPSPTAVLDRVTVTRLLEDEIGERQVRRKLHVRGALDAGAAGQAHIVELLDQLIQRDS